FLLIKQKSYVFFGTATLAVNLQLQNNENTTVFQSFIGRALANRHSPISNRIKQVQLLPSTHPLVEKPIAFAS
ncbi:MAG: hypothetical protein ACKO7B_11190, partial [Flavobacteriales bacterium]